MSISSSECFCFSPFQHHLWNKHSRKHLEKSTLPCTITIIIIIIIIIITMGSCALDDYVALLRISSSKQLNEDTTFVIVDDNVKIATCIRSRTAVNRGLNRTMSLPAVSRRWLSSQMESPTSPITTGRRDTRRSRWENIVCDHRNNALESRPRRHDQSVSLPTRSTEDIVESVNNRAGPHLQGTTVSSPKMPARKTTRSKGPRTFPSSLRSLPY